MILYYKQNIKIKNSNIEEINIDFLFNLSRIYYNLIIKNKDKSRIEKQLPFHIKKSILKKIEIESQNVLRRKNSKKGVASLYKNKCSFFELVFFGNKFSFLDGYLLINLDKKILKIKVSNNFKKENEVYMIKLYKRDDKFGVVYCYKEEDKEIIENGNCAGVDIGMDILFASFTNIHKSRGFLISGKKLKRINYIYTKSKKTENDKEKRRLRIDSEINLKIKRLFDYFNFYNVKTVFIGDFTYLKENKTAFNFRNIPHDNIKKKLNRVAKKNNIKLIWVNESYTSKCSFLDNETVNYKNNYKGVRDERGLFITKTGEKIHADLNGAANILAKNILIPIRKNILFKPFYIK